MHPEISGQGRGKVMKLRHFNKHFVKNTKKRGPTGKNFGDFSPRYFKTAIWMENVTQRWTQSGLFFFKKNQDTFVDFQKWQGRSPLFSLITHLWVGLNMHQYPWKSLNILENAWINCSDYARALNIPGHLTCLTSFWRCFGF